MHSQLGNSTETQGFTTARLSQARAVLSHSYALAEDVLADRVPLDAALVKVKDEQAKAWVREMSDDEAYMALVLNNAQSELHPLEEGWHAVGSVLSVRDYAEKVGMAQTTLVHRRQAAEVARSHMGTVEALAGAFDGTPDGKPHKWRALI